MQVNAKLEEKDKALQNVSNTPIMALQSWGPRICYVCVYIRLVNAGLHSRHNKRSRYPKVRLHKLSRN